MKILVTGGAGFIGSHIVDAYISAGHEVTVIDDFSTGKRENLNPAARLFEMDINDKEVRNIFERERFDILSHQAAQLDVRKSVSDPIFDAGVNILGSINLYEAAKSTGTKKIIFASSGGTIYGDQEYFPADENHPLNPCSPYGIAKLVNEKYLFYYKYVYGLDYTAFRYGNVYGPRQNPHGEAGVVAIFLNKMLTGQQPVINGDGKITRDYIYIDDIVRANLVALKENCTGIYNVGTGIEHDVNFIFHKLKALTNSTAEEFHGEPKAGEQKRAVMSYEKFNRDHGWKPETEFEKGLAMTTEYFRNSINQATEK